MFKKRIILLFTVSFFLVFIILGCKNWGLGKYVVYPEAIDNPVVHISRGILEQNIEACSVIHPNLEVLTETAFIDSVFRADGIIFPDTMIASTDAIFLQRRFFDLMTREDPHFRLVPHLYRNGKIVTGKMINVWPFSLIRFGDTLLVDASFSSIIKPGDRILEINQVPASQYLHYAYSDRYLHAPLIQSQAHFNFSDNYHVLIERQGVRKYLIVDGISMVDYYNAVNNQNASRIFPAYLTGYFRIDEFDDNRKIAGDLNSFLSKLDRIGYKNLILDLRRSPGGSGDYLEDILSLISRKSVLHYQKSVKVKISSENIDRYFFPSERVGDLVNLPERLVMHELELVPSSFTKDLNVYVLVSRNTGSMAACLANLIQYNKIGTVVGEPLMHNALKYGEVVEARSGIAAFFISTVQYEDYTRAIDGVLFPDVMLPYRVNEYLQGGDPVLTKLLKYITFRQETKRRRLFMGEL